MNSFCHDRDKMMMMMKNISPPFLHSYSDHVSILLLKKYLFIYRKKEGPNNDK